VRALFGMQFDWPTIQSVQFRSRDREGPLELERVCALWNLDSTARKFSAYQDAHSSFSLATADGSMLSGGASGGVRRFLL
jgi:hypothetical protein